jgi:anti-sigma factor RsiW
MSEHLNHDEMIRSLYGDGAKETHLGQCGDCQAIVARMESLRAASAAEPLASNEFLAAQRRTIYSRMGERPAPGRAWIPALAAAALVAVGLYVRQPDAAPQTEVGDAQLFSEIVSLEQTAEPRATQPIRALFEERE